MDILLIDEQSISENSWVRIAEEQGLTLAIHSHWPNIDSIPNCPLVILDQSALRSGFHDVVHSLKQSRPGQVLIVTGEQLEVDEVVELMRAGADFVFKKPLDIDNIRRLMPEICIKTRDLQSRKAEFDALNKQFSTLTQRERDVLNYVLQGVSNKNTADYLQVSVRTIEARRAKVYQKTGSSNVVELVRKVDRLEQLSRTFEASLGRQAVVHGDAVGTVFGSTEANRRAAAF